MCLFVLSLSMFYPPYIGMVMRCHSTMFHVVFEPLYLQRKIEVSIHGSHSDLADGAAGTHFQSVSPLEF